MVLENDDSDAAILGNVAEAATPMSVSKAGVRIPPLAQQSHYLFIEATRTWRACVDYGLNCAVYVDMFPILANQLLLLQKDLLADTEGSLCDTVVLIPGKTASANHHRKQRMAAIFGLFASLTHVAAVPIMSPESSAVSICWANVCPLLDPSSSLLLHLTTRLSRTAQQPQQQQENLIVKLVEEIQQPPQHQQHNYLSDLCLLSSVIHSIATHFEHAGERDCKSLPSSDPARMMEWNNTYLLPLLTSEFFTSLLHALSSAHTQLHTDALKLKDTLLPHVTGHLPSPPLPASWGGYVVLNSLWNCLLGVTMLLLHIAKLHPQLVSTWKMKDNTNLFESLHRIAEGISLTMVNIISFLFFLFIYLFQFLYLYCCLIFFFPF
mgnify:CR=1 FL=1